LSKENRLIRQAVFLFYLKRPLAFLDKRDCSLLQRTLRARLQAEMCFFPGACPWKKRFNCFRGVRAANSARLYLGVQRDYPQFMSGMFIIFPILGHGIFTN
jgi:hypothetical protein